MESYAPAKGTRNTAKFGCVVLQLPAWLSINDGVGSTCCDAKYNVRFQKTASLTFIDTSNLRFPIFACNLLPVLPCISRLRMS
ncbi:hypothetical protein WUBG_09551, partial [Wuchereria bancrofti]